MTTTVPHLTRVEQHKVTHNNMTLPFSTITEPGSYYIRDTGWLYRIPPESLNIGHSPMIDVVAKEEVFVTKISDDPWVPLNKARQICSNMDFDVNF